MNDLRIGALVLEPLAARHAEAMFDLLGDPALYEHLDEAPPASVAALRARYARLEARASPDGTQRWLNWVVRLGDAGPIGYVQATVTARREAWIAYVFARAHGGRGHATQAVACMIRHLAEALGVERFLATVERENGPSIRLLERLGFERLPPSEEQGLSATELLYVMQPPATGARHDL